MLGKYPSSGRVGRGVGQDRVGRGGKRKGGREGREGSSVSRPEGTLIGTSPFLVCVPYRMLSTRLQHPRCNETKSPIRTKLCLTGGTMSGSKCQKEARDTQRECFLRRSERTALTQAPFLLSSAMLHSKPQSISHHWS